MTKKYFIAIGTVLAFASCQSPVNKIQTKDQTLTGKIDTARMIADLAIQGSGSRLDLSGEKIDGLSNQLDTLELSYYFAMCDCQRWIVSEIYDKASKEYKDLDDPDPRGQVEFNLDKHGYYIEAADQSLKIDWRTQVNGTKIRFIGREYKGKRLPEDGEFTVPDPPEGKVFRYYSYQILKPYHVWGPRKMVEINKETGDRMEETTILTVK